MENKGTYKTIDDEKMDGRIKLTSEQKTVIKALHNQGVKLKDLALQYGVSINAIRYTVYPEELFRNRKLFKERGGQVIIPIVRRMTQEKSKEKIQKMYKAMTDENMFTLLRGLTPNQFISRMYLKDKTAIVDSTVKNNDPERKQIEVNRPNKGDNIINYSDIKIIIFKTK